MISVLRLFLQLAGLIAPPVLAASSSPQLLFHYVGSPSCVACHAAQSQAWQDPHHAKAMHSASEKTVLGDFNDASFTDAGVTTRFYKRDGMA